MKHKKLVFIILVNIVITTIAVKSSSLDDKTIKDNNNEKNQGSVFSTIDKSESDKVKQNDTINNDIKDNDKENKVSPLDSLPLPIKGIIDKLLLKGKNPIKINKDNETSYFNRKNSTWEKESKYIQRLLPGFGKDSIQKASGSVDINKIPGFSN